MTNEDNAKDALARAVEGPIRELVDVLTEAMNTSLDAAAAINKICDDTTKEPQRDELKAIADKLVTLTRDATVRALKIGKSDD